MKMRIEDSRRKRRGGAKGKFDMAAWHDLAILQTNPRHTVVVAGDAAAPADELLRAARSSLAPYALIVPVGEQGLDSVPVAAAKTAVDGQAIAYVCQLGSCQLPTADHGEMQRQLREGWLH